MACFYVIIFLMTDLLLQVEDTYLYIRVACIIKTPKGFLFDGKNIDRGYLFPVGGKITINETSLDAAKREILEELGMQIKDISLVCILENFYTEQNKKVHEICFIYRVDSPFQGVIPNGFVEVMTGDIDKYEIKPNPIIKDLLKNDRKELRHVIFS